MFPLGERLYDALFGLEGIAERLDNTQDAAVANAAAGDTNADLYNPTRTTDGQTVNYVVSIRASHANSDKVYVAYGVSAQLTVAQVIAQATKVLSAGEDLTVVVCAGSDTSALLQVAGGANNQAVTYELHEVRNRRSV